MRSGDNERPIDRIRKSSLSMQVGTPEDGAASVMIDMGSALYVLKEHAIYAVQLADQVDQERTNVAVPNTHQRILSIGTQDPEVGRIFLTAYTMFKSMHLGTNFPERAAWSHAFEYLRHITAMMEIYSSLVSAIERAVAGFNNVGCANRGTLLTY